MYHIGICDDGKNICVSVENMILQYARGKNLQIDTKVWFTGEGLKEYLEAGNPLDILFLDIELFRMTGIEVGDFIRNQLDNIGMQIIYISGKASYAQQLFKTQPLDFLIKPISEEQIRDVLERAFKILKKKNERFEFQQGKEYYYVPLGDILYFESVGRKVRIVTMKTVYEFYGKLREVAKSLSDSYIVIHKSYIVNMEWVYRYTYEMVELANGSVLAISPSHRKQVREKILREE